MHRNYRFASALLRDNWLLEAGAAQGLLPMLQGLVDSARLGPEQRPQEDDGAAEGKVLNPLFGCFAVQLNGDGQHTYKTFDEAPAGSTAIIGISGVILKDDFCDYGMNTKAEQIRAAAAHPNISSIIVKMDSPGGQANAPALAADAIREARAQGVPVLGWVDHGMVASAGYWIFAACTEGYLSQPTDQLGSIGAYQRVRKNGDTSVLEVYAPQSKQKNLPQRQAAAGDTSLLEAELGDIVEQFIASVQADRGDRLKEGGDHFEGGMFMGTKAVAQGLADGICTFAQAVARVQELADQAANSDDDDSAAPTPGAAFPHLTTDSLNPLLTVKYALLSALLGATTGLVVDKEKGTYLNETQLEVMEKALAGIAAKDTELNTTKGQLTTATTDLTETKGKLATAEEKLKTYANVPSKEHGSPQQTGDDRPGPEASADVDPDVAAVLALKLELGIPNK